MTSARASDRGFARLLTLVGVAAGICLVQAPEARASAALWAANCDGCHGATPSGARANAANGTPSLFNTIFSSLASMNGFVAGLTNAEKTSLGTYIESVINTTPQSMGTTPYNTTETLNLASKIVMGTARTGFNVLETITTSPTRGTVTYNTSTPSLTYNPSTCQAGFDFFSYRARNSATGTVSSTRTVSITIAATPTISSPTTHSGTVGVAIATYTIASSAFPCASSTTWGATNRPPGVTLGGLNGNLLSGTPTTAGTYSVSLSATNDYATDTQTLTFTVAKGSQTISWGAPTTPRNFTTAVQSISPLATGGASGNAIVYSSGSPTVCSVNNAAQTFTMLTAGSCILEANQAGNANYFAAPEVTRTVVINPIAPAAPTIGTGTPGPVSATVAFTPPTNNGGQPITQYTATCSAAGQTTRSNTGAASPITVGSMTNGVAYNCSVTATNATGTGAASGNVSVTPSAALTAPVFTSAASTTFIVQVAGTFTVTATGNPAPTFSHIGGALPSNVTFTAGTAVLGGTPNAGTAGSYPVTFRATNSQGFVDQSFTLTVNKQDQTISFTQPATPQSFSLAPVPLTASASSGLSVTFASQTLSVCTISGTNAVMQSVGQCIVNATQGGNTVYNAAAPVQRSFEIDPGNQVITFKPQLVPSRTFSPGGMFAINPTADVNSNLAIAYTSATPAVCSVSGTTVTMLSGGLCTIAADQAGNANWNMAAQQTQDVTIDPTVPDAPTIGAATPGNGQASIAFTPPANNGGSAITGYSALCMPGSISAGGSASPIVVTGLANGTEYTCAARATNAVGNSAPSSSVTVTPAVSGAALWQSACSGCHGTDPPSGPRFNAAGTTAMVLQYVRQTQPSMAANAGVQALNQSELEAIASYIAEQVPVINTYARTDTAKPISVASHLTLNTVSFTGVEVLSPPAVGTLSAFTGTRATYTPPGGFSGMVSFTYRGRRDNPTQVLGDPRSVTINVAADARELAITKTGLGSGQVTSNPLGLACGQTCTDYFQDGKQVQVTANANFGSIFTGWSGASCEEGVNTDDVCTLTLNADVALTANFASDSPPELSAPAALDFGTLVSGSGLTTLQAVVSNGGLGDTTPLSVVITGPDAADFGVSYPCTLITALTNCTFTLQVTPMTVGARTATLEISSNDPVNPTIFIDLTANVVAVDTTPNAFAFTDQAGVTPDSLVTSNPVTVSGINTPAAISVTGGGYAIGCTPPYTNSPGTIANGEMVCVRHNASAGFSTATNTVLTIGGVSDTFTSTTLAADTTPDAFAFSDVVDVTPGSQVTSGAITVSGVNSPAAISVTGGTYSIGCTATFTGAASTITDGEMVCVRHNAPLAMSATTNTTLTIGGVSDVFTSTTVASLPADQDFDGDGISNAVEIAESRNPFVKDNDIFTSHRLFAMQQYRDFLGREGDAGGIDFFVNLLDTGAAVRANVIESFFFSPEFSGSVAPIVRLYFATFLRIPDYPGLIFQVDAFRAGTPLDVIANNFTLSPEFQATYGALDNAQYVALLYQNILGRTASQGEIDFHVARLVSGVTRGAVLVGFSESPEYQQVSLIDVYVTMMYVGMLRRAPEQAGFDFWVDYMEAGNPGLALILGFLNAPEYRNRFLP